MKTLDNLGNILRCSFSSLPFSIQIFKMRVNYDIEEHRFDGVGLLFLTTVRWFSCWVTRGSSQQWQQHHFFLRIVLSLKGWPKRLGTTLLFDREYLPFVSNTDFAERDQRRTVLNTILWPSLSSDNELFLFSLVIFSNLLRPYWFTTFYPI